MIQTALPFPLSRASAALKRSVMRELMTLVGQPGILNFASGLPADETLPREQLQSCVDVVLTRHGARALQYGPPFKPLQELIAVHMRERGVDCNPSDIFITNGNQQGLELCARLLLDEGAGAAVEEFTFPGVMQAVQGHGAQLCPLTVDLGAGLDADAFAWALHQSPNIRLAILIPDFHNPLGVTMRGAARRALAALAARFQLPVIEDAPYAPLRFHGAPLPPLKAYDETGSVIYLGSFSKIISPALRLGWLVAPPALTPQLTVLRESLDLESSQLIQRTVAEFLARGWLEPHLARLNQANRLRAERMVCALANELGTTARWTCPDGGLFLWLTLPEEIDTQSLLQAALAHNVAFVPGIAFSARGQDDGNTARGANSLRMNFSNVPLENIAQGICVLAELIRADEK